MAVISDPIADMLTRIRNALMVGHRRVSIPHSKLKLRMAEILQEEGYILGFRHMEDSVQGSIELDLKYLPSGTSAIEGLKRVSRPGRRVYKGSRDLPRIRNGLGVAIISTSSGLMTDSTARKAHSGGEVLCYIW